MSLTSNVHGRSWFHFLICLCGHLISHVICLGLERLAFLYSESQTESRKTSSTVTRLSAQTFELKLAVSALGPHSSHEPSRCKSRPRRRACRVLEYSSERFDPDPEETGMNSGNISGASQLTLFTPEMSSLTEGKTFDLVDSGAEEVPFSRKRHPAGPASLLLRHFKPLTYYLCYLNAQAPQRSGGCHSHTRSS